MTPDINESGYIACVCGNHIPVDNPETVDPQCRHCEMHILSKTWENELSTPDAESPYDRGLDDQMSHFDPELIAGFFHRIELILEKCPIDIYLASSNAHPWPFRLQHYSEANPAAFHSSPTRILDSDITNPDISNRDLLKKAVELDATYVVAKDFLPFEAYDYDSLGEDGKQAVDEPPNRVRG